ncbi:GEVED domain-containing protein [Flavobacterium sp.]|uniref:GEVED domain-containing protein n=1 Tax=Flavobacterium sp. TaxID=239 RepID=UPI002FDECB8A
MINNYTNLRPRSGMWLNKQTPDVVGNAPNTKSSFKTLLALVVLLLSLGSIQNGYSQVAFSQNFDANSTGWSGGFSRFTGTTACGGAGGAMRVNLYSSVTTATLVSPQVGVSLGGQMTIGYSYKAANWSANTTGTNPWGSFVVQYSATASGPWTTIATISQETQNGSCINKTHTFTPPAGNLFIRFSATWTAGDYYLNFDNVTVTETVVACSGVPAPGNTLATNTTPCYGGNAVLSLQNPTAGVGVTYQWFNSSGAISGATSATYTTPSLISPNTYYCNVTCSGNTTASNPVTITPSAPATVPQLQGFNATTIPTCWSTQIVAVQTASKISFVTTGSFPTTNPNEGSGMVQYNSFSSAGGTAGSEERLISLPLNTTGISSVNVNFDWRNENNTSYTNLAEGVQVQYSLDGTTWINAGSVFSRHDPSLAAGTAQWNSKSVTIAAAGNQPFVLIAFKFRSEYGDNMFLDNVSIIQTPSFPPNCATALFPAAGATNVIRNTTLSWAAATGFPTSYDIYLSNTTPAVFLANVLTTSYPLPTALLANTTYYYKIVPKNLNGDAIGCTEQTFTTGTGLTYCTAAPTSIDNNGVTNVQVGSLSNPNVSTATYQDFTALTPPSLFAGVAVPITVSLATGYTYNVRVFADFNQDGDFNDAGENQLIGLSSSTNPTSISGTFSVPAGAALGNTRMRIVATDDDTSNNPCWTGAYANVEDYTINIVAPVFCSTPNAGTATAGTSVYCTSGSTTISVTGYSEGIGTKYQWESSTDNFATSTLIGSPANSYSSLATGTLTTTTSYRLRVYCDANPSGVVTSTIATVTINIPGTMNPVSGDLAICPGESTTLTASASQPANFAWTAPGGFTDSGSTITVSPTANTVYTVTATFANNCTASTTVTVAVAPAVTINSVTSSVASLCGSGNATLSVDASSGSSASYCALTATSTSFEKISSVAIGTINNPTTATAGYEDFTSINTTLAAGVAVPFTINISSAYANDDRVFINVDLDQNGSFTDPGELLYSGAISTFCSDCSGTATTLTGSITIPTTAFNGTTRMRIQLQDFASNTPQVNCGSFTYGQVEDYSVTITGGVSALTYLWTESPAGSTLGSTTTSQTTANGITTDKVYTVTVTSGYGCSDTDNVSIDVDPLPVVTLASNVAICKGSSTTITIPETGNSYAWSPAGGLDTTSGATVVANPTTTATYNVLITNNSTFCQNNQQITVSVSDPGSIITQPTNTVTSTGFGATFTVAGTAGVTYGYQWQRRLTVSPETWTNLTDDYVAPSTGNYTGTNTATLNVFRAGSAPALTNTVYRCILTPPSPCANLVSNNATLTVGTTGIVTNPQNLSICLPASTNPLPQFTVVTNGSTPTTLVWGVSTNGGVSYTNIPLYTISTNTYLGPNTSAVPGLTFALLETSPGVYDYKTLTVAGINASTPNNLRFRVTINTFVVSQPAILNISSPVVIDTNLSTTPVKVCYTPTATPTTFSIATSGSVGTVVWKYATSAGGTYTDVALGTPAGVSYTTATSANNYSLTVTTTAGTTPVGTYYYKAFVNSAGACASVESNAGAIQVARPTILVTQSAASYCTPGGSPVNLTASGANSYAWTSAPAGFTFNGAVASVSPTVATTYTVTGTDSDGCTNTATATVNVGSSFTLTATPSSATTICQGSSVNLVATPTALSGGGTANISFGTNLQSTGTGTNTYPVTLSGIPAGSVITSAQLQFTNVNAINGSYRSEIRVALSGAYSLAATQISTLTSGGLISPDPVINLSGFTATSGTINLLLTETYDDSGIDATFGEVKLVVTYTQPATYTYTWSSTPSGFTGSGSSTSATPAVNTSYSVLATSNAGCTATATTSLVTVIPTPVVTATNNGQPSATRCGTGKVNLTASGSAGSFLSWYAAATGGNPLFTGTTFQTPDLSTNTNYWVEATTYNPVTGTYCTPTGGTSSTSYYLNNITTTGGSSNLTYTASSYNAYVNNSATSFSQIPGGSVNVSMGMSGGSTYQWYCWVDWNADGDFDDAGETIFATTSYTSSPYAGVISVPSGQANGRYRVRFAGGYIGGLTACGSAPYGNYVDYTLSVGATCTSPSRTQVTAVVNPAPALALSATSSVICIGDSTTTVNITPATVGNYTSYTWSPSASVSGTAATGYVFNPTATTTYTLSATEPGGCVNSATYVVTVNPRPASTVASTSVASICADFALNLTSSATQILNNTYIDANTNGGFENGATFALNGWTVVNAATNTWQLGSVAGAASGTRGAYISNNGGTSWGYSTGTSQTSHFYRDIVIPAGAQNTTLTFQWKGNGESGWDRLLVYTAPTSVVPVANTPASNSTTLSGATLVWTQPNYSQSGYTTATVNLPNSLAGTTVRLIFTWQNDGSFGTSPAGAVDNISLTGTVSDALTYAWTSTPAGFTSGVQNPTNVVPSVNGIVYNVTVQNSFGCTSQASTAPVTVYPTPTAVAPANQLYYNGLATAAIPLSGTPSGVTYDISGGAAVGLANATGITTIPSFIPVTGSATVSITPKANGCTGATVTYNIVVTAVNANPIANQIYCQGNATAAIPLSSTPATVVGNPITYNMNVVGDDIGLYSATGLTEIPSFIPQTGTATVTVYPVYGGVFGGAVSATITVNPLPTATISGTTQVCRNDASPLITFTGANGTAPYTFTYTLNGGANQTIVSLGNVATIAVPTSSAGTYTYTLVSVQDSSSTTCSQAQGGFASVIVYPTPTAVAPANQIYYSGFATAPIPLSGTPAGVTFNISGGAAAGLPDMTGITTIPSFIPTTTPATVTITPVANGCVGVPVSYQISFRPVIVNIASNVCGSINNGLNNQINCTQVSVPGFTTTGYQFEVTNTDTGVVSIVQSSQHHFKLTDADNYAYGTTFTIRVAAILNGNVQGYFGTTCSLTTASVATTKVVTAQCGATLLFINSTINANSVSSTNLYRFRVALATAPTTYYYVERTVPNFKLTDVAGLPLLYDTEYKVDVQIRVKLAGFEAWSQYGQRCSVFTPSAPETSLVTSQCEDYQVPSYTTTINAIAFPGATKYRFRLVGYDEFGDVNYDQYVDSTTPSFTLSMFTGLTPSTTYTVSVAMELFGSFTAYGKDCSIITPSIARQVDPSMVIDFKATAYPNPFAANFMLNVRTSSSSVITIKVYDMVGRLVEARSVTVAELENATIGDRYPSGVYNVVVSQDETVETVRVVKR